ncbi:MAG: crossover junction endodeoxyribonuclease RuvC [Candidatus Gracilibacteria bacterium]|nr:crossover junction endodeoxyribonuclease RuvC [Candidatus Gracilibacteria bacterium]
MSIILGIDPGTTTTGFAIIEKSKELKIIDYGVIETTPKDNIGNKLLEIGTDIGGLFKKYKPDLICIEKLFFTTNIKTGIDVSHARGVIVYEIMKKGINYLEFTPLEVKRAITGYGKASKKQVQNAIKILLKLNEIPKPDDARDALCLAYIGSMNIK